jgi:hypothetical protein
MHVSPFLREKGKTHGEFKTTATVSQELKYIFRQVNHLRGLRQGRLARLGSRKALPRRTPDIANREETLVFREKR